MAVELEHGLRDPATNVTDDELVMTAKIALAHALEVRVPEGRYVIEMTPIRDDDGANRGVVAEGVVGSPLLRRLRVFRYEIRRWRGGVIPDIAEAVASPVRVSEDEDQARRLLELVPRTPTPVCGRDDLHGGEMWTSNSVTSWLLARSGVAVAAIKSPACGRAPGWDAGVTIPRRCNERRTLPRPQGRGRRASPGLVAATG